MIVSSLLGRILFIVILIKVMGSQDPLCKEVIMKTASRHYRVISLAPKEDKQVSQLQDAGVKIVAIFRKGLNAYIKERKVLTK